MEEATLIHAEEATVFVEKFDENQVWLSIQGRRGGQNCVIPFDEAKRMMEALQEILSKQ